MAFATGHNPRTGFVAGQLRDGDSFGTVDVANFGGQAVKFQFDIRYYKGQLFVIGSKLSSDGKTVLEKPSVVSPDWIKGVAGAAMPNKIQALTDLAAIAPTKDKMASLGVSDSQVMPTYATGDLIPFEQNADGFVKAYMSPTDQAKAASDAQTKQTNLLTTLTQNLTGNTTPTTTTTGGAAAGMSMTVKIVIGVVVAAVVGGIIYAVTKKKKGGSKK